MGSRRTRLAVVSLLSALLGGAVASGSWATPDAPQPSKPPTLLFSACANPSRGIKDDTTLYVLQAGRGAMKPAPVLTKQGLDTNLVTPDGCVILTAYLRRSTSDQWRTERYLYQCARGTVRLVDVPEGEMTLHDARAGSVVVLDGPFAGLAQLRVYLLQVPSMRVEEWPLPQGLAESRIGKMQSAGFAARMSPDGRWLALLARDPPKPKSTPQTSLVVLERDGGPPRVLDSGLWPGWSPNVSWSRGPSLAWVDDHRLVWVDEKRGPSERGSGRLRMADVTTGRVRTLLDGARDGRCPGEISRDPRTGTISWPAAEGKRWVLDLAGGGLDAQVRLKTAPERFLRYRDAADQQTAVLRDAVRKTDVWRGCLGGLGSYYPSPDGNWLAFTVRPKPRDLFDDLYVYDGRTGRAQKVFRGYLAGGMHWVTW